MTTTKSWQFNPGGKQYRPAVGAPVSLPPGLFDITSDNWTGSIVLHNLAIKNEKLCRFSEGQCQDLLTEINSFWGTQKHYEKLGVPHKRGLLLHGDPGCGKTSIVMMAVENIIGQGGLAIQPSNLRDFADHIGTLRMIEPNRPLLVIFEDVDQYGHREQTALLELLDGSSDKVGSNVLFVGTTNYLERIPVRIRARPSRFDTLIEIKKPTGKQRIEYLKHICHRWPEVTAEQIEMWAENSDGYGIAALKELVIASLIHQHPLEKTLARLQEMQDAINDGDYDED